MGDRQTKKCECTYKVGGWRLESIPSGQDFCDMVTSENQKWDRI